MNETLKDVGLGVGAAAAGAALGHYATESWRRKAERTILDGKPAASTRVDAAALAVDADTFQFKSGGDRSGVTDRLQGVKSWNAAAAGKVMVYEYADGRRVIADGHQRLGLAQRLMSEGHAPIKMDAIVLKQQDGWSPRDVRAYAAIKNMHESSGQSLDMARVMRERPDLVTSSLPVSDAKVREAKALANLSDDAFKMAASGAVEPGAAAAVGEAVRDSSRHVDMIREMSEAKVRGAQHARLYVQQALAAPSVSETTSSLFGDETQVRSLTRERSAVLDRALTSLKSNKRLFALLEREAATIEDAGNKLAHAANTARADTAARLSALVEKLATQRGNVSSLLDQAAKQVASGETAPKAARSFLKSVQTAMEQGGIKALVGDGPLPMAVNGGMQRMVEKPSKPIEVGRTYVDRRRQPYTVEKVEAGKVHVEMGGGTRLVYEERQFREQIMSNGVSRPGKAQTSFLALADKAVAERGWHRAKLHSAAAHGDDVSPVRKAQRAEYEAALDRAGVKMGNADAIRAVPKGPLRSEIPNWPRGYRELNRLRSSNPLMTPYQARAEASRLDGLAKQAQSEFDRTKSALTERLAKTEAAFNAGDRKSPDYPRHFDAWKGGAGRPMARADAQQHIEMQKREFAARIAEADGKAKSIATQAAEVRTAVETYEKRGAVGWSDAAREASAKSRGVAMPGEAKPAEAKPTKVKAPKGGSLAALKGVQINAMLSDMALSGNGTRAQKEARIIAAAQRSEINRDTVKFYSGDLAAAKKTMAEIKAARATPSTPSAPQWSEAMGAKPHAIATKPPHRVLAEAAASAGIKDPNATFAEMFKQGGKKTLGILGPVGIVGAGVVAWDATRNQAHAAGKSSLEANTSAAVAGAGAAGTVAAVGYGIGKVVQGAAKLAPAAGRFLARAVPAVAVAAATYEAGKGAIAGYKEGGIVGAAKGAATGVADFATMGAYSHFAGKPGEGQQGRLSAAQQVTFAAAESSYQAMQEAKPKDAAGGWSDQARIAAYEARMQNAGQTPVNLPYGGAPRKKPE